VTQQQQRDQHGRFIASTEEIVDTEEEFPLYEPDDDLTTIEAVVVETSTDLVPAPAAELAVIPEPSPLPERLLWDALGKRWLGLERWAKEIEATIAAIEALHRGAREPVGVEHTFTMLAKINPGIHDRLWPPSREVLRPEAEVRADIEETLWRAGVEEALLETQVRQ
jgi:hypothetical protein